MKVHDILDYSEIEANKFSLKREWIRIKDFIKEIHDIFKPNVTEKQALALNIFLNKQIP